METAADTSAEESEAMGECGVQVSDYVREGVLEQPVIYGLSLRSCQT